MKISTKVECGIIAIADIAMNSENGETVTVYSVAERRGLSGKYLEQVLTSLRQARLIKGIKGSRGGYILNKKPEKITIKEIIDALDPSVLGSDVAVVNDENTEFAQVLDDYIWLRLENKLKSYTESITLRQLVDFYNKESAGLARASLSSSQLSKSSLEAFTLSAFGESSKSTLPQTSSG